MEILTLANVKEYSKRAAKDLIKVIGKLETKAAKGDGEFQVIASTSQVDRAGEVIDITGWDFENYMKNPVVLWAHDYSGLPIGVVTALEVKDNQLVATGIFANTEDAQEVRQLYDDGIIKAVSVGFMVKERNPANYLIISKAELLEVSFVPVPCNPDALSISKILKDMIKTAVPPKKTDMEDEGTEWDAAAATARIKKWASDADGNIDFAKYKQGFAWYDAENTDKQGGYKLPHHDIMDGGLKVVWRGTAAAMAALLGSRGGVDIPEADKQGVYDHLVLHYKQFEKEAPELKSYTQYELDLMFEQVDSKSALKLMTTFFADVKRLYTATKADIKALGVDAKETGQKDGRVLSAANRAAIEKAITALQEVLAAADAGKTAPEDVLKSLKELLQNMDKMGEKAIILVKDQLGK